MAACPQAVPLFLTKLVYRSHMKPTDLAVLGGAAGLALFVVLFASNGLISGYVSDGSVASTTSPKGVSGARAILASLAAKNKDKTATSTDKSSKKKTSETKSSENMTLALGSLSKSLVNIVCDINTPSGQFLTSGSGVIIDSRGIILTNAHVAQFLLLKEGATTTSCSVRTGSPASTAYSAELVYISGPWISAHPGTALSGAPTGTGEHDFALLAITGSRTPLPLPGSFPAVPLTEASLAVGKDAALASYGAQGLSAEQVKQALFPTLAFGSIKDVYAFRKTFDLTAIDLIALGANKAAQAGSSGGGVVNGKGELVALITTSSPGRNVSAITAGHIARSFRADVGDDIDKYLSSRNPSQLVADFQVRSTALANALTGR